MKRKCITVRPRKQQYPFLFANQGGEKRKRPFPHSLLSFLIPILSPFNGCCLALCKISTHSNFNLVCSTAPSFQSSINPPTIPRLWSRSPASRWLHPISKEMQEIRPFSGPVAAVSRHGFVGLRFGSCCCGSDDSLCHLTCLLQPLLQTGEGVS